MSYGWALIVIALIIGVLIFVTSGATGGVVCLSKHNSFVVKETSINAGLQGVGMTILNASGGNVNVTKAEGTEVFSGTGTISKTVVPKNDLFTITWITAPQRGTSLTDATVTIDYNTQGGLNTSAQIICNGTV